MQPPESQQQALCFRSIDTNWPQPDSNLANQFLTRQYVELEPCHGPVPRLQDSLAEGNKRRPRTIGVNNARAARRSRPSDERLLDSPAAPDLMSRILQYLFTSSP